MTSKVSNECRSICDNNVIYVNTLRVMWLPKNPLGTSFHHGFLMHWVQILPRCLVTPGWGHVLWRLVGHPMYNVWHPTCWSRPAGECQVLPLLLGRPYGRSLRSCDRRGLSSCFMYGNWLNRPLYTSIFYMLDVWKYFAFKCYYS
jgi:hypothetical protein